ncbi:MAG: hypothetical protein ACE5QV_04205 [Fidelibacterota bacterium]
MNYVDITAFAIIIGAIAATLSELIPLGIDDNLSIPLISASSMAVIRVF